MVDLAEMREREVQRIQIAGNSPDKSNCHRLSNSVESFVSEMNEFEITHCFFFNNLHDPKNLQLCSSNNNNNNNNCVVFFIWNVKQKLIIQSQNIVFLQEHFNQLQRSRYSSVQFSTEYNGPKC